MKTKYSPVTLFSGNKIVVVCVLFSIGIITHAVIGTVRGEQIYLTIELVILFLLFIGAGVIPLAVFQYLFEAEYIDEDRYLLWTGIPLHYFVSCALLIIFAFLWGCIRSSPISINSHFYSLVNFTISYAVIHLGAIIISFVQTMNANKDLRKIQSSVENSKK